MAQEQPVGPWVYKVVVFANLYVEKEIPKLEVDGWAFHCFLPSTSQYQGLFRKLA